MIINKKSLIAFICVALITKACSMEKKNTEATEVLERLLNFDTDSVIIGCGKTIFDNEAYNSNPKLLAAYSCLVNELTIYKNARQGNYHGFVGTQAVTTSEELDIKRVLMDEFNDHWRILKKKIEKVNNLEEAIKGFNVDLVRCCKLEDKDVKIRIAIYKEWMKASNYTSTKYLIEMICKLMGKNDLVNQEQGKILELLKKYDNL